MTGAEIRALIRSGAHRAPTAGLAADFVQTNLVIVPEAYAADMRALCARNPVPCPLIEEVAAGAVAPRCAPGADLRSDVSGYRLWRHGGPPEKHVDLMELWRDDFVTFLIGCSFTFERALLEAGLVARHVERGTNVPMYRTNVPLMPAGELHGHMVVSMRPYLAGDLERVRAITRAFPDCHGEPVHWGDPAALGIAQLERPDEGDPVPIEEGELPVFWGCGVTPQNVALESKLPLVITHEPGHMFVTDMRHRSAGSR